MAGATARVAIRSRVHSRIRRKLSGTSERPRLAVFRSNKHIYAQLIDDVEGRTLAAASTRDAQVKGSVSHGGSVEAAKAVGKRIAEKGLEKGLQAAVFDRGGFLYLGRVRALAEAAREAGLKF